jgi:hypothetical protein
MKIVFTQSFDASITTTRIEMVVTSTMDVVKRGVLIGFVRKLGSGLGGVLVGWKLNGSSTLPIITIGVVGTPQMVFTNLIMTTHVNRIINRPSMSLMANGGYKIINVANPIGGY